MNNQYRFTRATKWLAACMALSLCLLAQPGLAQEKVFLLSDEQWNIPRTESSVLKMPTLQSVIEAYQAAGESGHLLIKYPGGDEGTLWAYELRAWFISLGIASHHIELVPGARKADQLEIYVMKSKGKS